MTRPRISNTVSLLLIIIFVASIGIVTSFISKAAPAFLALSSESGTVSSPAVVVSDTSADNGKAIGFKSPVAAAPLIFDGRFTNTGSFGPSGSPAPWSGAEYVGSGSKITVYNAATKQTGWPQPHSWSANAAAFTSVNDSVLPTVRSQVHAAGKSEGSEYYSGWAVNIPSSIVNQWPLNPGSPNFFLIQELHGPPYNGSPGVSTVLIRDSNNVPHIAGLAGWGPVLWKTPVVFDSWMRVQQHIKISKTPANGLLEVWVNETKQTFISLPATGGSQMSNYNTTGQYLSADKQTAHIATILSDTTGPTDFYLNNYRTGQNSAFGNNSITIFHAGAKIGNSLADTRP